MPWVPKWETYKVFYIARAYVPELIELVVAGPYLPYLCCSLHVHIVQYRRSETTFEFILLVLRGGNISNFPASRNFLLFMYRDSWATFWILNVAQAFKAWTGKIIADFPKFIWIAKWNLHVLCAEDTYKKGSCNFISWFSSKTTFNFSCFVREVTMNSAFMP